MTSLALVRRNACTTILSLFSKRRIGSASSPNGTCSLLSKVRSASSTCSLFSNKLGVLHSNSSNSGDIQFHRPDYYDDEREKIEGPEEISSKLGVLNSGDIQFQRPDYDDDEREKIEGLEDLSDDWVDVGPWAMTQLDKHTHFRRDVPGFTRETLKVAVLNDTIMIKGEFGYVHLHKKIDVKMKLDKNIFNLEGIIFVIRNGLLDIFIPKVQKKQAAIEM